MTFNRAVSGSRGYRKYRLNSLRPLLNKSGLGLGRRHGVPDRIDPLGGTRMGGGDAPGCLRPCAQSLQISAEGTRIVARTREDHEEVSSALFSCPLP
ncbi:MAG: hypothetical protein MZU79_03125 [Anaerotruncus sp.]|nr:hypothetical protein [Anaerotruncus sp.]